MPTSRRAGFALIGTPIAPACKLPFRLASKIVLRRATPREVEVSKTYLMENSAGFENTYTEESQNLPGSIPAVEYHRIPLPEEQWRYFVVAFSDFQLDIMNGPPELWALRVASHLTRTPLYINPFFMKQAVISDFTADYEHYKRLAIEGGLVTQIALADAEDWKHCYGLLQQVQISHPEIRHSFQLYSELPIRAGHNDLTTLGLFAVLESLLTHNPQGEDDSIGRQIRSKIALVGKRLELPIDYAPFGRAPSDTVWKRLYELRSRIAHGTPVDFDRALQILDDTYKVEQFMWQTVRTILRAALREPDLFVDLKAV